LNSKQNAVRELLEKVKQSTATEEDCNRLISLLNGSESEEVIGYANRYYEEQGLSFDQSDSIEWKDIFKKVISIDRELTEKQQAPARIIPLIRYWAVASVAVLLFAAFGIYLWNTNKNGTSAKVAETHHVEIQPGRTGALLTLEDGSKILLDTIKNGTIALQSGVTAKIVDGTLVYEGVGSEPVYNVMETPKGRNYHLVLPDGSQAWLNASSSIRYPTVFTGKERKVEMTGEVYFEVVKNAKQPFTVKINDNNSVDVLGTHFNINAYSNENTINTTLLEGSIRLTDKQQHKLLKPGQQARVKDGISIYGDVNIDQVMAWKNGLFDFEGLTMGEVIRQLERWYDIDIELENGVKDNIEFTGGISRGVTLSQLLEAWKILDVHYTLEGRKLTIKP
jgi:transmembrane sensor